MIMKKKNSSSWAICGQAKKKNYKVKKSKVKAAF